MAPIAVDLAENTDRISIQRLIDTLKLDKKVRSGQGVFVLPTQIAATTPIANEGSHPTGELVSDRLIEQVLTAMLPIAST